MIVPKDTEKAFGNIQYPFMINNSPQTRNRKELQLDKGHIQKQTINTGIPCFVALHRYCTVYKLKVCGNPASSQVSEPLFQKHLFHFVSLHHILVNLAVVFQTCAL